MSSMWKYKSSHENAIKLGSNNHILSEIKADNTLKTSVICFFIYSCLRNANDDYFYKQLELLAKIIQSRAGGHR